VNRFWCILFLLVPILGVATFVVAPYFHIWFPRDISVHGRVIDQLFMFILWLTGIVFIATEVCLFYFMWKYDGRTNAEPVKFSHGSHTLEVVWTILPTVTLLFIAIYQMNAWADAKMRNDIFRYDGEIHLPMGEEVLLLIKSSDVLHSLFLPNVRMKQDVVPGMAQYMWFKVTETGEYDIVCAELCGWGHYKMKGRATFEAREDYDKWLAEKYAEQEAKTIAMTGTE
jgi:cytochrome c oxidase subunit II